MWVPDGPNNRWLSFDTKTEKFVAYAWPRGMAGGAGGNSMALHPDGTIWATGANKEVRRLNPEAVEFKAYPSPSAKPGSPAPGAYGLAVAGDGSVWWAEDEIDKMARVDPATGKVEEFTIPDVGGHAFPRRMNTDANGDLWVALWNAGKLMKIDYKTKEMTVFTPPSQTGGNYSVIVDKKNNYIWVSEHQVDKVAPLRSEDAGVGRVPVAGGRKRSASARHRSDQPEIASSSPATPRAVWVSWRSCRNKMHATARECDPLLVLRSDA